MFISREWNSCVAGDLSVFLHNALITLKQRGNCHSKACQTHTHTRQIHPKYLSLSYTLNTFSNLISKKNKQPSHMESYLWTNPTEKEKKKKIQFSFLGTDKIHVRKKVWVEIREKEQKKNIPEFSLSLLRISWRRVPTLINDSALMCTRKNRATNSFRLCVFAVYDHINCQLSLTRKIWRTKRGKTRKSGMDFMTFIKRP